MSGNGYIPLTRTFKSLGDGPYKVPAATDGALFALALANSRENGADKAVLISPTIEVTDPNAYLQLDTAFSSTGAAVKVFFTNLNGSEYERRIEPVGVCRIISELTVIFVYSPHQYNPALTYVNNFGNNFLRVSSPSMSKPSFFETVRAIVHSPAVHSKNCAQNLHLQIIC